MGVIFSFCSPCGDSMQLTRRLLNAVATPRWHSFFHKSEAWKTQCSCANQGVLYVTDAAFCLTQRWSTARAELNQVLGRLKRFDITLGDLYKGGAMGIQLFLIFHAGKVLGRGSFQGYSLGPSLYDTFPDKNAPKGHH